MNKGETLRQRISDVCAKAKPRVNGLFRRLGYEIHAVGHRRVQGEVFLHCARLGLQPATVIDVGVAYGTPELYRAFPHAFHILIDPINSYPENIASFLSTYRGVFIEAAAGCSEGSIDLYAGDDPQDSTIYAEMRDLTRKNHRITVALRTIDAICDELQTSGRYVIKVDTQGSELEVLKGAPKTLLQTELVVLEVSLFDFSSNGVQLYDVVVWMKQHGFVVYDIVGGHNRPVDNALAQVDIAFVRDDGMFRRTHFYA